MTDRELLEMAAKAAGISGGWGERINYHNGAVDLSDMWILDQEEFYPWNPLEDDGDALRLAVKLNLIGALSDEHAIGAAGMHIEDPYAATRHAIVRAAAEIGKKC